MDAHIATVDYFTCRLPWFKSTFGTPSRLPFDQKKNSDLNFGDKIPNQLGLFW